MTSIARPRIGAGADTGDAPGLLARAIRGPLEDSAWVRPALIGVAALAAFVYLWDLTISGYANTYYAQAAQAASQSWSAWFFGSLDAGNFITVDKPPLSTMVLGLSVRLFGLNSWSILLPQAVMGVATVLVLFAAVRRSFGGVAGVIAALVMALTPVAVLIFRFDNPDALLTLLLVLSAWAFLKGMEHGRLRWLFVSALLVGLAFDTKFLQAWLVLPAFALTYLIAAPGSLLRRLGALAVSLAVVLVASGWWVAVVDLIPAGQRPFIGGSTDGTALQLLLGYDGLGRIFGGEGPAGGGGAGGFGGGGGFGGAAGLLRMFNSEFAGQISWLIPFALIALVSGLAIHVRARRTDRVRAGYLLWGLWLGVHVLVFSLMSGIIHPYYSVIIAPAVGALVGAGIVDLWKLRERSTVGGLVLGGAFIVTAAWSAVLLDRTPDFFPGLGIAAVALAVSAALILIAPATWSSRRVAAGAVALGLAALLVGPAAYAVDTMGTAYGGGDPKAGPQVASDRSGFGGGAPSGAPAGAGAFGGFGGFGGASADTALTEFLVANKGDATWIVAVSGSGSSASIQLATGEPVMAMGGFTGSDPAPTLDQLKVYVASGQLRYIILGGRGGPGGGFGGSSAISEWVTQNGTLVDYGGSGTSTLYDLAGAASGS